MQNIFSKKTTSWRDNKLLELFAGFSWTQLLGENFWIQGQGSLEGYGRCKQGCHCTLRYLKVHKIISFLILTFIVNPLNQNKSRVWLNKSISWMTLEYIAFTHSSLSQSWKVHSHRSVMVCYPYKRKTHVWLIITIHMQ